MADGATSGGCPERQLLVGSGQHGAFALGFGDGISEPSRGVDPQLGSFIGVGRRFLSSNRRSGSGGPPPLGQIYLLSRAFFS
jgi:hypothetical protein